MLIVEKLIIKLVYSPVLHCTHETISSHASNSEFQEHNIAQKWKIKLQMNIYFMIPLLSNLQKYIQICKMILYKLLK
jgi:hypothetical protein